MTATLEEELVAELAEHLTSYLPVDPAWDTTYTFLSAVREARVERHWGGGSAFEAIESLLLKVLEEERGRFRGLIETIVEQALHHRERTREPLARQEVDQLCDLLDRLQMEVPKLRDPVYRRQMPDLLLDEDARLRRERIMDERIRERYLELSKVEEPNVAARQLRPLLNRLLKRAGLKTTRRLQVEGGAVTGAFALDFHTVAMAGHGGGPLKRPALEAFRESLPPGVQTLGLMISIDGFDADAVEAANAEPAPRYMLVDGAHLYRVLLGELEFGALLRLLVRFVAAEAAPYVPMDVLLRGQP